MGGWPIKKRVAAFELYADHGSFEVIDPEVHVEQLEYNFYDHKYEFVPGEAIFLICGDYVNLAWIEVWLADKIEVGSDAHFAVVIPFEVGSSGIHVDLNASIPVDIPTGNYAFLYEMKFRDENSDHELGSGAFCRLTFVPQDLVEARELVPWDDKYFWKFDYQSYPPICALPETAQHFNNHVAGGLQIEFQTFYTFYEYIGITNYCPEDAIPQPDPRPLEPLAYQVANYECAPGRVSFRTCKSCSHVLAEIWLADEIVVRPDALYAAVVPFSIGEQGFFLSNEPSRSDHHITSVPEGNYALLYELKLRNPDSRAYQTSVWYDRDELDQGKRGAICRLTFVSQDSVEAQELIPWDKTLFSSGKRAHVAVSLFPKKGFES